MIFDESIAFLSQLDTPGIILLFWHTVIFELPRYFVSSILFAFVSTGR